MAATIQGIFQEHFAPFAAQHRLPLHRHQAAQAICQCRTAALGGHVQRCPEDHVEQVWYNSCKHRSCPTCSALPSERWLEAQKSRLLGCDHYHVVFTLPHQLLAFWWCNTRLLVDLLFRSASASLLELLQDEQYLGAVPGIVASLHTWGRNLSRHPHLHCLVTGGGFQPEDGFRTVTGGYLLPVRVLRAVFRGKFMDGLYQALRDGALILPGGFDAARSGKLFARLASKVTWHVHVASRYPHGHGVATYLARYVKGGPLGDQQLQQVDDQAVVFRYTDHRDQRQKPLSLTPPHFVQRLLWHVPEPGQHTIRYYGLYHPRQQERRARCRAQLGQPPEVLKPPVLDWQRYWQRLGHPERATCPVCGRPLVVGAVLPKARPPPFTTRTPLAA